MSTVLNFRASTRASARSSERITSACEIVIFPGVRIERNPSLAALDLGHRLRSTAGDAPETGDSVSQPGIVY